MRVSILLSQAESAADLRATLRALSLGEHDEIEVLAVECAAWTDACLDPFRAGVNFIARGRDWRNACLAAASGELVAFLAAGDCPQPEWPASAVHAFATDDEVALAGPAGPFGAGDRFCTITRLGEISRGDHPFGLAIPGCARISIPQPSGAVFHRMRLMKAGEIDARLDRQLAVADAAFRLIDRAFTVKVFRAPGVLRRAHPRGVPDLESMTRDLNARIAFVRRHGPAILSADGTRDAAASLIERACLQCEIERGAVPAARLKEAASRADEGRINVTAPAAKNELKPYPMRRPAGRRLHLAFFCQWHCDPPMNGAERVIHQLAHGLASRGHTVRLMTRGGAERRIALEDGVWVHWVPISPQRPPATVPRWYWSYSASLHADLLALHASHPVDAVQCPNWDSEGIAAIAGDEIRTVLAVYTPFKTWLTFNAVKSGAATNPSSVAPIIETERFCYQHADHLLACGPGIVEEIERQYELRLDPRRIGFVAHGLIDRASSAQRSRGEDGEIRILFVGRVERRKGADTVLECVARLCRRHPHLRFVIVGDDRLNDDDGGPPLRDRFEESEAGREFGERVLFTGMIDEQSLWQHYANCDIFAAPSRFESFGLILVEAMMFGRPAIGAHVIGMSEIISDGMDGFLVPPGDAEALATILDRLIAAPSLRETIGRRGRETYERKYTLERMIENAERFYLAITKEHQRASVS